MKTFGELLRDCRLGRKMTQQDLADRLGLSSPYIAQMESGFKPPPPQSLVEKIGVILHLGREDRRLFLESAEKERELQSLVKATRKAGYLLSANKVCVPEKAVTYRLHHELENLIKQIPANLTFSLDTFDRRSGRLLREGETSSLQNPTDLLNWAKTELSEQPAQELVFLGLLFEVLLLTPDERLLCRQPTSQQKELSELVRDVGAFFRKLRGLIDEAKSQADEQNLPDVIAPHEVWRNIDDVLGTKQLNAVENVIPQRKDNNSILNVPIVGIIEAGSDEFEAQPGLGMIGLPMNWFNLDHEYEACMIQTDAYVSLGVWPGCKAVYELDRSVENDDLVVVQLGDRRCIRKFFDMGDQILLQGGPLSRPIRVNKDESSVRVLGVVRELISRFKVVS